MAELVTMSDHPVRLSFRKALAGNGVTIVRGEDEQDPVLDFARSTAAGLSASPRRLEYRFLYDARGSDLYGRITGQPEYYLTRTEAGILASNANRIREITGPVTLVELGSGSSEKTEYLLRAWLAHSPPVRYVPVDISSSALRHACDAIAKAYPTIRVIGMNADYRAAFPLFREASPAMVCFLGSSIGNFSPLETSEFFASLAESLSAGDFFLVGIDLVKDPALIEAAYNDSAGLTAEFTLNIFARMNRELDSGVDLNAVRHEARYNREKERVEIYARFIREQTIRVAQLGKTFTIEAGDSVLVEISRKFRLASFVPYLERFGLEMQQVFIDGHGWFAMILVRKAH